MRNKAVTALLLIGFILLIALSIANLVISKEKEQEIRKYISTQVSQISQSPQIQQEISAAVKEQLPTVAQKGDKGDPGASGSQGQPGKDGQNGMNGTNGKDGKSAYDVWVAQGNKGTEQDFLNSLVGPKGDQGPPGEVLQLQWSATGQLEFKYSQDDFYQIVPKAIN